MITITRCNFYICICGKKMAKKPHCDTRRKKKECVSDWL